MFISISRQSIVGNKRIEKGNDEDRSVINRIEKICRKRENVGQVNPPQYPPLGGSNRQFLTLSQD